MISQAEANAETDKERRQVIEASNQADSVCADTEKAITEFGESLSAEEKESVQALIKDLRELSMKAQAGDAAISSETIKNKVGETQQASLKLFQKVRLPSAGFFEADVFARSTRLAPRKAMRLRHRPRPTRTRPSHQRATAAPTRNRHNLIGSLARPTRRLPLPPAICSIDLKYRTHLGKPPLPPPALS
jgi:hypothetical protein